MKKQMRREKIVAVQEKTLESVQGGTGYIIISGDKPTDPPTDPTNGGT